MTNHTQITTLIQHTNKPQIEVRFFVQKLKENQQSLGYRQLRSWKRTQRKRLFHDVKENVS